MMRPSAGLFDYETELCTALAAQLKRFDSARVRLRYQLQVGAEIPDFILTLTSAVAAPRISAVESAILAQLREREPLATECVAGRLYTQSERVAAGLARLSRLGLVTESALSTWTLTSFAIANLLSARVIAIEAKLTRWQDALAQAISYRRFANLSFVALPLDVVRRRSESLRADCRRHHVGLLGVSTTEFLIDVAPPAHDPWSADWLWTVVRMMLSEPKRRRGKQSTNCAGGSSSFAD